MAKSESAALRHWQTGWMAKTDIAVLFFIEIFANGKADKEQ